MRNLFLVLFLLNMTQIRVQGQQKLSDDHWQMNITEQGHVKNIIFYDRTANDTIPFFEDHNSGPAFYTVMDGLTIKPMFLTSQGDLCYNSIIGQIECRIRYISYKGNPSIEVTLTNNDPVPFQPEKCGISLGIDTYMDSYPRWFKKYFPTLMRCEKDHFFGYLQTPAQRTLAVICEQPIASWSVDYNLGYMDPYPYWFMGHRIEALNLDLINCLPLPDQHPQDLYQLKQGESKQWIISFVNIKKLEQFEPTVSELLDAPVFELSQTTCELDEQIEIAINASQLPRLTATYDSGLSEPVEVQKVAKNRYTAIVKAKYIGEIKLATEASNRSAQAILTVHRPWKWVMERAREATLKYKQKATSHGESIYGFYSAYLAARYFPDPDLDSKVDERFEYLFDLLHDTTQMQPKYYQSRIQNTSTVIGILVDKYQAHKDINDLERAKDLADWMIKFSQREDGAYYNNGTIYTSVIYVAKSVLELAMVERELAEHNDSWKESYEYHYNSAKRAIDQLVNSKGNFQTEGEHTYEDGMISCSALQIGMFALMQESPDDVQRYKDEMIQLLEGHNCLTQLRVPDGRQRQGTMRYWEAQYDVMMLPNMFNSPHGWSGWRAYATYYAYLLTGDVKWLEQTYNAMGAFANLIDPHSGDLRWAFVVDPHLKVAQTCESDSVITADSLSFGNPHPQLYKTQRFVIGQQYVNMVSDWQGVNTQDNDVHEVFKCLAECFLTNAFVVELPNGEYKGYNCSITKMPGGVLRVDVSEDQIVNLHCNIKKGVEIEFGSEHYIVEPDTLGWITK